MKAHDETFPFGLGRAAPDDADGLADGVVKQLELALAIGLINDGDKLPPEPKLAEQLGVSTVTLRQGLSKLRSRGLLVTQRGRGGGSYMRDRPASNEERAEELLRPLSAVELRDLGDLHAALLGHSAGLAAARSAPDEIARLHQMLVPLREAKSASDGRRAYCRLHIEITVSAQSPQLMLAIVQSLGRFAPLLWNSNALSSTNPARDYSEIIAAIEAHDKPLAQSLTQSRLEDETRMLIERHLRIAAQS